MAKASWLEVSLTVDGELAESVAEVLARFIPDGVVIESTAVATEKDSSQGRPVGPLRVFGYLPADERLRETRQRLEEALWYLGRIRPLPPPQFRPIFELDWSAAWKRHYKPVAVGRRLMIVPSWLEPPSGGRIAIRIDPGMAFGTGTHPSTQLCLELIEEILANCSSDGCGEPLFADKETLRLSEGNPKARRGMALDVIDIGCGSGILSIAALKLGARRALGLDVDADALRAARQNAELNGVADCLELGLGSVAEVKAGAFSLRQAPLVLANILASVLIQLLDEGLGELVVPRGVLVLSGMLDEQARDVESALQEHDLRLVGRRCEEDWVALWATRTIARQ